MTLDRFHSKDVQINEDLDFSSLVSNKSLLKALESAGYKRPSPIQLKTIPLGRLGLDLVAQAKSGTGKTIVFSIVAIESVLSSFPADAKTEHGVSQQQQQQQQHGAPQQQQHQQQPKVVIIAPTREIAVQIQDVVLSLTQSGFFQQRISCYSTIGGMPIQQDKENLKRCSIVVGTPGRIRSLITTGDLKTNQVRLLVLDEADKLMEDTFQKDVIEIAKDLGPNKQVMAFSATYDDDLLAELDKLVKNPVYVMLSEGAPELEGVTQFFKVAKMDEAHKDGSVFLKQIHMMEAKFTELENLFTHVPFYQAIVFLNHRGRAADLVKFLTRKGWPSMHIASGISQEERLAVMTKARKFELRVLVCSDLIARGIDIDRVNLVVNLDLPKDPETYLHRIGRTGRYGTAGLAVSIVDSAELATIEILRRDFGITIQELSADDKVYKGLKQTTKHHHHHERPLQLSTDVDQFKKLEAERTEGEKRSHEDDQAPISIDIGGESKDRPQESTGSKNTGRRPGLKRRKLLTQDRHTMVTPKTTLSVKDVVAQDEPVQVEQLEHSAENDVDEDAIVHDDPLEPERDEYQGTHIAEDHPTSHGYYGSFIPLPLVHPPFPFQSWHPHYPVYPHPLYAPSAYRPVMAPRSVPTFIPPDLPLFPFL